MGDVIEFKRKQTENELLKKLDSVLEDENLLFLDDYFAERLVSMIQTHLLVTSTGDIGQDRERAAYIFGRIVESLNNKV